MKKLNIQIIPSGICNYSYLIHDIVSGKTVAIDPYDSDLILQILKKRGWKLSYIFTTHHHLDHIRGNLPLKKKTGCAIYGHNYNKNQVAGLDIEVKGGQIIKLGAHRIRVIHLPGHTLGSVAYHFEDDDMIFVGDVLFAMGCGGCGGKDGSGMIFDGTYEQMFDSLKKITRLPANTEIYSGHEAAHGNARFALSIDSKNKVLQKRFKKAADYADEKKPFMPVILDDELKTNPFLRTENINIRKSLEMETATPLEVFTEMRKQKDSF